MATKFTPDLLKTEIMTDPVPMGFGPYVNINDGKIVEIINDRTRGFVLPHVAAWSSVLKWMAKNAYRSRLQDAATTVGNPNRDVALAILDLINGAADGFDANDPDMVALFTAIVPVASQPALLALANVPASRAEVLWGYGLRIDLDNVSFALRGYF